MAAARRSQRSNSAANVNFKEIDENDSWDDSDDDQQKATAAGTKRKAARADKDDQNPAPARKRQHTAAANIDLHDLTLLEILIKHSNAIDKAVKEWVERYKGDRAAAAAELWTLLVKVAGCDQDVTADEVEAGEVDQLAQRLGQTVEEEGGVEVLRNPRAGRAIAANYCTFWDKALRELARAELLFDDFELNDKLVRLVTALNISTVRNFRHAATLTAAQLVSSWISISAGLTKSRELAKFQLDAEEKKKKKAAGTIAALKRTLERCHTRVEDLKNFRNVTFTGVFSHRFRDVDEGIRAIVIESIGNWIAELPTEFLADTYLKYLGWALSDQSALVRGKAVAAISKLYTNSENVPRLQEFANRFTPRFVELMADIDESVAAAALHLLAQLVQLGVLKHKEVSDVFKVLTHDNTALRHAAAELVVQLLEETGRNSIKAAAEALQEAAAATDTQPTGRSKSKGSSKTRGAAAGQQSAATAAATAMLEDSQKLQLAGLLAVMASMSLGSATDVTTAAIAPEQQASQAASPGSAVYTLSLWRVVDLVDALWEHLHEVLGDVGALADELADEGAGELRGRLGNAHLASLLAAAVYRAVHPPASVIGRKGRGGMRARQLQAAADGSNVDEDVQQEVTVVLIQKLPALLSQFQAEPVVVAPLLAIPPHLKLEQWQLSSQTDAYRDVLQKVDGLLQKHSYLPLINEATAVLVHASKNGPAALQEIGTQVLHSCCSTSAAKLASAATAVSKLRASELAEGIIDLAHNPSEAPDALLSLLAALQRIKVLIMAGADELSRDKNVAKACQTLLQQSLTGRELGAEIMQLLVHTTNTSVLWQQRSAQNDAAVVASYLHNRSMFMRVLEALLDSGAGEHLARPDQPLAGGTASSASEEMPAEVMEQVAAGVPTLQDLAAQLLMDHIFIGGGLGLSVAAGQGEAATAWAREAAKLVPSNTLLSKLWHYCNAVLDREGPDVEALADGEADEIEDEEQGGDADFEGWDVEDAARHREARRAARRDALLAAATNLALLRRSVVLGLVRLVEFKAVPDPGYSYLLSRLVTLLDGQPHEISNLVRVMLQQLKSSAPEAAPAVFLNALTALYEETMQGEDTDDDTWEHLAAVSSKIASLYPGHNLSQGPLHSLVGGGITWALEDAAGRADFLTTCLMPFTAKLAPSEAEQVARELQGQLSNVQEALGDDEADAVASWQSYLASLEDRAAGKKPTRGVLKTPGRPVAASDDEHDAAANDTPATAARSGKRKRKDRIIKFAADVELQQEDDDAAAGAATAGKGRKRAAAASGNVGRKRAKQQQQQQQGNTDDEWDNATDGAGQQPQQSSESEGDGWHAKRSGTKSPAKSPAPETQPARQQRGKHKQQQQVPAKQLQYDEQEDEDGIEEFEEPAPPARGRLPVTGGRSQRLHLIDSDAGPLNTQSQSQRRGAAATATRSMGKGKPSADAPKQPAVAEPMPDLAASSEEESERDEHMQNVGVNAGVNDLAAGTDEDDVDEQELQHQEDEDELADEQDEEMDELAENEFAEHGGGLEHAGQGGGEHDGEERQQYSDDVQPANSQYSEPLPSLNVVLDDIPDDEGGEEVQEPPRTKRGSRRRR